MPSEIDYYEVLGLNKNATDNEIKNAYRQKIRENHPDLKKNLKDKEEAEKKVKLINKAYNILTDPAKKKMYDTTGSTEFQPNGNSYGDVNFGDFDISDLFGGFFDFGQKTSDIQLVLNVSIKDVMQQNKIKFNYFVMKTCNFCNGVGFVSPVSCKNCNGQGSNRILGLKISCKNCNGVGKTGKKCIVCKDGFVKKEISKEIIIPKYVKSGNTLHFSNEGNVYKNKVSDLLINIKIQNDENFYIKDNVLFYKFNTTLKDCLLRKQIKINIFKQNVILNLPAYLDSETIIIIDNYGLWATERTRGKLHVVLKYTLPLITNEKALNQLF